MDEGVDEHEILLKSLITQDAEAANTILGKENFNIKEFNNKNFSLKDFLYIICVILKDWFKIYDKLMK